jgi:hypothetical protein
MSSMICYTSEMRLLIEPAKVLARLGTSGASRGAAPPPGLEKAIRSVEVASEPRLARLHLPVEFLPAGQTSLDGYCPRSTDLARRLEGCSSCTIFMLTLGAGLDGLLESASSAPSRQVILDAAASEAAEDCARWVQRTERAEASRAGRKALPRFSPGFGDFGLDNQAFFVQRLPGLGITISGSGMLIPRKTVTGVIGWR